MQILKDTHDLNPIQLLYHIDTYEQNISSIRKGTGILKRGKKWLAAHYSTF